MMNGYHNCKKHNFIFMISYKYVENIYRNILQILQICVISLAYAISYTHINNLASKKVIINFVCSMVDPQLQWNTKNYHLHYIFFC